MWIAFASRDEVVMRPLECVGLTVWSATTVSSCPLPPHLNVLFVGETDILQDHLLHHSADIKLDILPLRFTL